MGIINILKILITIKLWFSNKWNNFFNIKEIVAFNESKKKIKPINLNNKKIYDKIMIKYYHNQVVKRKVFYNTNTTYIKTNFLSEHEESHVLHKPIISLTIKIKKNKYNISLITPLIKEYDSNTLFNDIILFHFYNEYKLKSLRYYKKIYIQTLRKMYIFKFSELKGITVTELYKKMV